MKKKILILVFIMISIFTLTACGKNEDALKFKEDYEEINGEKNSSGKKHREVKIDENNPFVTTTAEDIVERINNKETFYVYFGSRLCPWCRSVIEKAIEVAKNKGINTIYYVDIWDEEGNEILRDKYILDDNGKLKLDIAGTDTYFELLDTFKDLLDNYTITDSNNKKIDTGEKRIFAPNYIYIKKGKAIRITTGISDKQKDSREKLTKEMLNDEEKQFKNFFK